jgi:hypothetical protein
VGNFIIAGAAAAAIVLGASNAYALPSNSPCAIWVPASVDQGFQTAPSLGLTTPGSSLHQALEHGPRLDIPSATSSGHNQHNDVSQWGHGTSGRIVINANSCAPDRADPVWDRNSVLLGYSCNAASANGG